MILALVLASFPAPHARVHVSIAGQGAQVVDQVDVALRALGLEPLHGEKELAKLQRGAKPLTKGEGDSRFALELELHGSEVRASVKSLQRAPDIVGRGVGTISFAVGDDAAKLALDGALTTAISTAFSDLRGHLDDDRVRPRAHLQLVLLPNDLLDNEQKTAALQLAKCAAELAEPLAMQPTSDGGYDLEVRLDPGETLAERAQAYAGRLHLELGPDAKARCSTRNTPLEPLEPVIVTGEREVRLRFEQAEP